MAQEAALPAEISNALSALGSADIVVGIPTHNNADTIVHVVRTAHDGLLQFFPDHKAVIVNPDSGSTDETPERIAEIGSECGPLLHWVAPAYPVHRLAVPYHGIPGKAEAVHAILQIAHQLNARACLIVRPDLLDATPVWIDQLVRPILDRRVEFILPYYSRHRLDGGITNGIVGPLIRSLYGKRIHQPVNGDHAFGSALVGRYLAQGIWRTETGRTGIDIWMSLEAICSGVAICEVSLGERKHPSKDTGADLSVTLSQVVGSVFEEMNRSASFWHKVRGSRAVPMLGMIDPASTGGVRVDVQNLIRTFRLGHESLHGIWGMVLPPSTLLELRRIAHGDSNRIVFPDKVWVRTVFDFALGYRLRTMNRDHLLGALTPLFLAWMASFAMQVQDTCQSEFERRLEELSLVYESEKPYLISRWRWPDRFSP